MRLEDLIVENLHYNGEIIYFYLSLRRLLSKTT